MNENQHPQAEMAPIIDEAATSEVTTSSDETTAEALEQAPRPLNSFEQRRADKADRYRKRATNATKEADNRFNAASGAVEGIPFGQPILVGHHSEKRHRAALNRHDQNMRAGFQATEKAEYYEHRAQAMESNTAIFSDDPDASEKLEEKIARLEKRQQLMKDANAALRKNDDDKLRELGFSDAMIEKLKKPELSYLSPGFQKFELSNNNANINRLKKRLEQLQKRAEVETSDSELPAGVRLVQNVEANRTQLFFPGKPPAEIIQQLKRNGFKWSRYESAWQRHLSSQAEYLAKQIAEKFAAQVSPSDDES